MSAVILYDGTQIFGRVQVGQVTDWMWSHDIRLWFSENSHQTYSTKTSQFDKNRISSQRWDRLSPAQWTKNILSKAKGWKNLSQCRCAPAVCLLRKKKSSEVKMIFSYSPWHTGVFPHYELHIKWFETLNPLLLHHFLRLWIEYLTSSIGVIDSIINLIKIKYICSRMKCFIKAESKENIRLSI